MNHGITYMRVFYLPPFWYWSILCVQLMVLGGLFLWQFYILY